jgi:hypothetical protein
MVPKEHVEARGRFERSYGRLVERTLEPGLLARLMARVLSGSLDRALIAGCDPAGSPRLAARAAALTELRSRAAIGEGLELLLETAGESAPQNGAPPGWARHSQRVGAA